MDTVGGGFIKGVSASSDANIDVFIVGNTQSGKLVLNSGSLILEVLAGNGNNAFSGVVDLYTDANNKTAIFEMNGGSVISKAKGTEAIRVADKHTGTSKAELIVNNGLINVGIYVQGTSNDASEIITVNGGTILAERPTRSTLHTFVQSKWKLSVVITLNGGNITSTNPGAWGSTAIVYNDIIGTTYASGWDLTKSAHWIFSITDNR